MSPGYRSRRQIFWPLFKLIPTYVNFRQSKGLLACPPNKFCSSGKNSASVPTFQFRALIIGLTRDEIFWRECRASFSRGSLLRWEYSRTRASCSTIVAMPSEAVVKLLVVLEFGKYRVVVQPPVSRRRRREVSWTRKVVGMIQNSFVNGG